MTGGALRGLLIACDATRALATLGPRVTADAESVGDVGAMLIAESAGDASRTSSWVAD
jgi:hypothetical protein